LVAGLLLLFPLLIGWPNLFRKPRLFDTQDPKV